MGSEATTFILDVSPAMVKLGFAEQAMAYIEYVLFMKAKKQRKTDWVNCYLANCPLTRNNQKIDNVFELLPFTAPISADRIIEVLQEMQTVIDQQDINGKAVNSMVQSLLVSSVGMRDEFNKRKVKKQIMIFTCDLDGLDLTEQELDTLKQELDCRIILVTCGLKQEEKVKLEKSVWEKCVDMIPGSIQVSMAELIEAITTPIPSSVKPVCIFHGELRLGAPIGKVCPPDSGYSYTSIKVEGYPATKAVPSLNRRVVAKVKGSRYEPVKAIIEYEALDRDKSQSEEEDEEAEDAERVDGKKNKKFQTVSIARESVTKAYRYGTDYVVLPPSIESERVYHTSPSLDIRGFVGRAEIPRHYLSSESTFILPSIKNGTRADTLAITALVDSMIHQNKLAIARYVQRTDSEVQLCVLCPLLIPQKRKSPDSDADTTIRALVLSRLPFSEDERVSDYPRLTPQATDASSAQKNAEIDGLMEDFVESRTLGSDASTTWYSTPLYRPISDSTTSESSLPLPNKSQSRDVSVFTAPAMGIHRTQQILVEYMHQKIVGSSDTFDVPELPIVYEKLLNPKFDNSEKSTEKLQERLAITLNTAKSSNNANSDEQQDEDEEYYDIPSLESLLARGKS
ncbi:LAFA_0F10066g1_1 [Lachancea sp. 'fantastica']|nr:LAFA_0F10066g1_1 [Lachancea sp. 'fantastica']